MNPLKVIYVLLLYSATLFAQNEISIDSLRKQIASANDDSTRTELLYKLSREYWDTNLDSSISVAQNLLQLSQKINLLQGIGNAYSSMGVAYWYKGDYPNALKYNTLALEAREKDGDRKGVANSYNNIGLIYDDQGNFPLALEYYLNSLRVYEALQYKDGISQAYNNIGIIHYSQKHYPLALENLKKSIHIREETKDEWGLTESYSNIGLVYFEMKNYDNAFRYYQDAVKLREKIDDREGLSISYVNFGDYYYELGKFNEALEYYHKSLDINQQMGYRKKEANLYLSMSNVYEKMGQPGQALEVQLASLSLTNEIGAEDVKSVAYRKLSQSYANKGDFKQAYHYHQLYKETDDSLFNSDRVRSLTRLQMQYDFDKKEALAKAEQVKRDALTLAEIRRQKIIRYSVTGGLAGVLLFLIIVFRQRNRIAREKKRSDNLLLNILPTETAEELKATGSVTAKNFDDVTVLFTDFKNFTRVSENMPAAQLVKLVHFCYSEFDRIISEHRIEKIKTIGDAYMCVGGLPVPNATHAEDVVSAALAIRDFMAEEKMRRMKTSEPFFDIRIGIHTGCVVAGVVGTKKFAYDIWGDTVNVASRMESAGEEGRINISASTYERVKEKFPCTDRGKVVAKNKGETRMYFVN